MSFTIELTQTAQLDIAMHRESGNRNVLRKIDKLLNELRVHPEVGTGKPERLKYFEEPVWSRRITDKHRMVYRIHEDHVIVLVLSCWGHYDDK